MAILDFLSKPFAPEEDDSEFLDWYSERSTKTGISSDPYEREHYYDYKAAYKAGAEPAYNEDLKKWKWPSEFKHDLHPDRYIINKKDLSIHDSKYDAPAKFEDMIMQIMQRKEHEGRIGE